MSAGERIIRVAAKGDGISESGKHVPGAAPEDVLLPDGTLEHGPHHVEPPCRHFGKCGGCQLQHLDEESLTGFIESRMVNAAAGQGMEPERLTAPHLSPPHSRRRATLHGTRTGGRIVLGFRETASHRIVDMRECHILRPELFTMVAPIRLLLAKWPGRLAVDIELTLTQQGIDVGIKGLTIEGLEQTEAVLDFARENGLARLMVDQGYGPEVLWEPEPVLVALAGVSTPYPAGAFLQATSDGEAVLTAAARNWLEHAGAIADLFSGLGTFAFALAGPGTKVLAVEAARNAHLACKAAAAASGFPVHAMHRDLFRNPLQIDELNRFEAVLLDPPRAGAREQAALLAQSTVPCIVYVSCNPSSWARDGATLAAGGYKLAELRPVGQFRWSTHVELASLFVRA